MITDLNIPMFSADIDLGLLEIVLRLFCSLLVGIIIGTEREYTHRPAGMRTHMLVALGACVVMIIGQLIFMQYQAYGATPDPARMAAQVITGVGFLGAGTIMKEGASVKGLTTAASLWATACLGLASGAGYYAVALTGMVFIFATLTIFEVIQKKLIGFSQTSEEYRIITEDIPACLTTVNRAAEKCRATVAGIEAQRNEPALTYTIIFRVEFPGSKANKRKQAFFERLVSSECVHSVQTTGELAEKH